MEEYWKTSISAVATMPSPPSRASPLPKSHQAPWRSPASPNANRSEDDILQPASIRSQTLDVAIELPAESDDVEIGKIISSKGDDTTLEAIFEEWCGMLASARTHDVKDEDSETIRVPVDSLRFTQRGCSDRFQCGRLVSEAVDEFVRGSDPAELPWCVLRVIRRAGLLLSVTQWRFSFLVS